VIIDPSTRPSTYYNPYGPPQHSNTFYLFTSPPLPTDPPPQGKKQEGVKFVQPSPMQQVQAFEQIIIVNLDTHPIIQKIKGRINKAQTQDKGVTLKSKTL